MADNEQLAYDIIANYDGSGAKQAAADLAGLKSNAGEAGGAMGALGNIAQIAGGVALGGIFSNALDSVTGGLGDLFTGAMGAQDATAKMSAMLDLASKNGNAAGLSIDKLNGLAETLTSKTTYSDESIKGVISTLLKFQDVSADAIPQTTQSVLDLATSMGTDATTAAQQLGKALENPLSGMRVFQQAGFSKTLQDQIKDMAKHGDVAGADDLILKSLGNTIGGLAEKMGETASGRMAILMNKFDDMRNQIGEHLLPLLTDAGNALLNFLGSPQVEAAITTLEGYLDGLVSTVRSVAGAILDSFNNFPGDPVGALADMFYKLGDSLQQMTGLPLNDLFSGIGDAITKIPDAFQALTNSKDLLGDLSKFGMGVLQSLADSLNNVNWSQIVAMIGDGLGAALQGAGSLVDKVANAIGSIDWGKLMDNIGDAIGGKGGGGGTFVTKIADAIGKQFATIDWGAVFQGAGDIAARLLEGLHMVLQGAGDLAAKIGTWLQPQFSALGSSIMTWLTSALQDAGSSAGGAAGGAFSGIVTSISGALNGVAAAIMGQMEQLRTQVQNALNAAGAVLQGAWNGIVGALEGAWAGFANSLTGRFLAAVVNVVTAAESLGARISEALGQKIVGAVQSAFSALAGGIQAQLTTVSTSITTSFNAMLGPATAALDALRTGLQQQWALMTGSAQQAATLLSGVLNALGAVIGGQVTAASRTLSDIWKTAQGYLSSAAQTISGPLTEALSSVPATLAPVQKVVEDFTNNVLKIMLDTWNSIIGAIQSVIDWLNNLASTLKDLKLPDWLTRHSPSPFEQTLWGSVDALREMSVLLPQTLGAIPAYGIAVPSHSGTGGSTGGSGGHSTVIHLNIGTINGDNGRDIVKQIERELNERWGMDAANAASLRV